MLDKVIDTLISMVIATICAVCLLAMLLLGVEMLIVGVRGWWMLIGG